MITSQGHKRHDKKTMSPTQHKRKDYEVVWIEHNNRNYNQQVEKGQIDPRFEYMKEETSCICLDDRKEDQRLVLIVLVMAKREVWNMLMFSYYVGT